MAASAVAQVADVDWIKIVSGDEISLMEVQSQFIDLTAGINDGSTFNSDQITVDPIYSILGAICSSFTFLNGICIKLDPVGEILLIYFNWHACRCVDFLFILFYFLWCESVMEYIFHVFVLVFKLSKCQMFANSWCSLLS